MKCVILLHSFTTKSSKTRSKLQCTVIVLHYQLNQFQYKNPLAIMQKVNEQMICSFAHWSPDSLVDRQTASLHLFPIHASPEYQSLLNCIYSTKTYKKDIKQIKTNLKRRRKTDQNSLQKHTIPCILCIPIPIASLTLEISERDPFLLRAREAHCTILPSLKLKRD